MRRCHGRQSLALSVMLVAVQSSFYIDQVLSFYGQSLPSTNARDFSWPRHATNLHRSMRFPLETQTRNLVVKRPHRYWHNVTNVQDELVQLWQQHAQLTFNDTVLPPIPNQSLLYHWKRHDLRGAIAFHGGPDALADLMVMTTQSEASRPILVPGRWSQAVQLEVVQRAIAMDPTLSTTTPPKTPRKKITDSTTKRWKWTPQRKQHGFWSSEDVLLQELFQYLEERRKAQDIPAVWMPRLVDLTKDGRDDLSGAILRMGGMDHIQQQAGLIAFAEWNYIEGMHELLWRLQDYQQDHPELGQEFPVVSHLPNQGYDRLHWLIQYYGGRKFLAARLDMNGKTARQQMQNVGADMNWGPFDLEFGIDLYALVRRIHLRFQPPLPPSSRHIAIPSQRFLLQRLEHWQDPYFTKEKGIWLHEKIQEYGGYENVARRLGLEYNYQ